MNAANQIKLTANLKSQRLGLMIVSCILLISNILLTGYLFKQDSKIVIVPTHINKEFALGNDGVTDEYLELMARDLTSQILNLTADNYEYVKSSILKLTHPSSHGAIKQELNELSHDITERNVSINFYITEMLLNKHKLQADVSGYLETKIGLKVTGKEYRKYRIIFGYNNARITLKEFYEVKDENKNL